MFGFMQRRKFREIVRTQLVLFEEEWSDLLQDAREALRAYAETGRESAEEAWSRFDDIAEDLEDALLEMRDRYADHMDESRVPHYSSEFRRQSLIRFRDVLPHTAYGRGG